MNNTVPLTVLNNTVPLALLANTVPLTVLKLCGWESIAFVLLNRALDLHDAIEDGSFESLDNGATQTLINSLSEI